MCSAWGAPTYAAAPMVDVGGVVPVSFAGSLSMDDLSWALALGGGLAFFTSFGIGANDVANAFASSVGSGAITYRSAVGIAAVFEFSGAVFLGSHVTGTIRKGIADLQQFCTTSALQICILKCGSAYLSADLHA